jgi:YidC/Oxa1 family membrane protein insertase
MIPLVVKAQQNAAKMNNNLPQMQVLQMKMSEARQSGNQLEGTQLRKILT